MNTSSNHSSTASLLSHKTTTTHQPKNYEAALGSLSSTYGFSGTVPSVPSPQPQSTRAGKGSSNPSKRSTPSKNHQAASGRSSTYDLSGGNTPSLLTSQISNIRAPRPFPAPFT
ncbi:hypothetical protein BD779DRAFT_1678841 [Infundibulicybe gibba]|nr:hypothetical protein BD779DRAFT_1678841 [Infundibulicybe gibba]